MTETHRRQRASATTANPVQGVRVEKGGAVRRTEAGRIALPVSVGNNGEHLGEGALVMTYQEWGELHADVGRLLAEAVPAMEPRPEGCVQ